jgi:hypothetical protein
MCVLFGKLRCNFRHPCVVISMIVICSGLSHETGSVRGFLTRQYSVAISCINTSENSLPLINDANMLF